MINLNKYLTFSFDVQLNDNEDYIPARTKVEIANVWKQYRNFTPVIINKALDYHGNPIKLNCIEYFMNSSFDELR